MSDTQPFVCVIAPISSKKEYVIDKWLQHIFSLTYSNFVIVLVDNSSEKRMFNRLKSTYPEIHTLKYFSPKNLTSVMYITHSQNILIAEAKKLQAEYVMSIECDVFPPTNIIELLLQKKTEVACGVYPYMDGIDRRPLLVAMDEDITGHLRQRVLGYEEALLFCDGKTKPNFAQGIGCALIKMSVFDSIGFRFDPKLEHHSDTYFYQDLYFKYIDPVVDTSIICKHENSSWDETKAEDNELLEKSAR
jgi:GT2 family glycosyltransferase